MRQIDDFLRNDSWHIIIDQSGLMDEFSSIRLFFHYEPGVHSDAMPTYTRTWLMNVDPRMIIAQADRFPDIDAALFADQGQFIGIGNIDITEGILS